MLARDRPEGHANADLVHPLRDVVRNNAIDTDGCECETQSGEAAK